MKIFRSVFGSRKDRLSRARRRRAEQKLLDLQAVEREAFIESLTQQLTPNISLFLSAALAGALIGLGFRFPQAVLFFAGVLLAPRLKPILGLGMSAILGSKSLMGNMLFSLLGVLVTFAAAVALTVLNAVDAGEANRLVGSHAHLNLLDFVLLLGAAVLATTYFVRESRIPALASAAVAYELFLPLATVIVGILAGETSLWQGAAQIFSLHLVWAVAASASAFFASGFRPLQGKDRSVLTAVTLMGSLAMLSMFGLSASLLVANPAPGPVSMPMPTKTPTIQPTATNVVAIATEVLPTQTPTLAHSPTPSRTASLAPTITPTPQVGIIANTRGLGALIREFPNGPIIASYLEGVTLILIGGPEDVDGEIWYQVRTPAGQEGWVLGSLVATATPKP
jgi:uncharacterized membrane protein